MLIDDHAVVRTDLSTMLADSAELTFVAQTENGKNLRAILEAGATADMIIRDVEMPVMDGLSMLAKIALLYPAWQ